MADQLPQLDLEAADAVLAEIDRLIEELAQLAKSDLPAEKFYAEAVERVVAGLSAIGGTVWIVGAAGALERACQVNPPDPWLAGDTGPGTPHFQMVERVLKTGKSRAVPPRRQASTSDPVCNPTGALLLLSPWSIESVAAGVIEIFHHADAGPEAQRGYLRFLEVVGEVLADFVRNRRLRELRQGAGVWGRFSQFAVKAHGSLDLQQTAYTVANEGRRLLGCDRLSVLVRHARRCRLLAVSGVDAFRRRANVVRALERLTSAVLTLDEPLWHPGRKEELSPELERLLTAYLDESHARCLAVLPLHLPAEGPESHPGKSVGAIVVEHFSGHMGAQQQGLLHGTCTHAAVALKNASELDSLPLARLLRKVRWVTRAGRLVKIGLVLGVLAVAVAVLAIMPADFNVEARGELQPTRLHDVFARSDGTVTDLRVEHGQPVRSGELLAALRRPQLDFEFKQVWGELQTARKKLASIEAERLRLRVETDEQRQRYAKLTADEEEVRESVRGLQEQYAVLQRQQAELEVRSPAKGEILTWNVRRLLEDRPVSRGQAMLTVGDLSGPWRLELRVPDRRVAHVLAAQKQRQSDQPLDVTWLMAAQPGVRLSGTVESIAMRCEAAESEPPYVAVRVAVDRDEVPELVPGAGVKATIHCGRRAVGYVWLHDLLDAIRTWLLF
jgi:multidrug efflux pump subunit AcrA (membrane-fusion protein)